jgi:hypothetical protein
MRMEKNVCAPILDRSLEGCKVGDPGVKALVTALRLNTALKLLVLDHNRIGNGGAADLGHLFRTNTTLVELDLDENSIGDVGMAVGVPFINILFSTFRCSGGDFSFFFYRSDIATTAQTQQILHTLFDAKITCATMDCIDWNGTNGRGVQC